MEAHSLQRQSPSPLREADVKLDDDADDPPYRDDRDYTNWNIGDDDKKSFWWWFVISD